MRVVRPPAAVEPPEASLSLQTALAEDAERIVATMLELRDPSLASLAEARQFLAGFHHLVQAAAAGDTGPRDEYLSAVIPGVRGSGFPLDAALDALIRASMSLTAVLAPAHHAWAADFCGDYIRRFIHAWNDGTAS